MLKAVATTLKPVLAACSTAAAIGVGLLCIGANAQAATLVWSFTGLVQQNFNPGGAVGPTGQTISGSISFDPYHASATQNGDGVSFAQSLLIEASPYPLALVSGYASDGFNTFDVNVLPSNLRTGYSYVARDTSVGGFNGQLVGVGAQVLDTLPPVIIQLLASDSLGAASTFFNDSNPTNFDHGQLANWLAPGVTAEFLFQNEFGWVETGVITSFTVAVVPEPPAIAICILGLGLLALGRRRHA